MGNIIILSRGTYGDIVPFIAIGRALVRRGHQVTIISHCDYEPMAREANINFAALDTHAEFESFLEDGHLLNTPQGIPTFFQKHLLNKVGSDYRLIEQHHIPNETVIIARYMSDLAVLCAAERLSIPYVRLFTTVASINTMQILEQICATVLARDINAQRGQLGLDAVTDWRNWMRRPQYSLAPWPEWFTSADASWPAGIVSLGFLMDEGAEGGEIPPALAELLDKGLPPVLISGGTGTFLGKKFYSACIDACRLLDFPAILTTPYENMLPDQLPDNVHWFKRLPFATLMPRVKAIIHHGGTSTLARAIAAGVPQLALAYGGDRPDTALRLEKLGVAEFLPPPRWHPEVIADAVRRLMESESVRSHCRELAARVAAIDPVATACRIIEQALAEPQSQPAEETRSAELNLPVVTKDRLAYIKSLPPDKRTKLLALLQQKRTQTTKPAAVEETARPVNTEIANTVIPSPTIKAPAIKIRSAEQQLLISVTATFTAEPLEQSLSFWMKELDIAAQLEFAPYNQVFQQLLDPNSLLSKNRAGINVVLLRFEDWQRKPERNSQQPGQHPMAAKTMESNLIDLILALKSSLMSANTFLICLCPPTHSALADSEKREFQLRMRSLCRTELKSFDNAHIIDWEDLMALYPVTDNYDQHGEAEGKIPYTPEFFASLGTMLARRIFALRTPPRKVIVLDCDNTLWRGVCGEDGLFGIEIDNARLELQRFIVKQQQAGMLVCLCSKNNEEDVFEVFSRREDMILTLDHLVSWRINWRPKSENLRALAAELNLNIDSFIFIDDDPRECAEVESNCPQVLTLCLPKETTQYQQFLHHVWAFDRLKITAEDRRRTSLYKENLQRENFQKASLTIQDFIASLKLKVEISEMQPDQIARVAQLTQRTNQFNFTTIRRNESELAVLSQQGDTCLVIEASDRFGDYGMVGMIIYREIASALVVENLLLSCRALGRGVEHRMVAYLATEARARGLATVDLQFQPTRKNRPAEEFVEQIGGKFKTESDDRRCYHLPVEQAINLTYQPTAQEPNNAPGEADTQAQTRMEDSLAGSNIARVLNHIAVELNSTDQILRSLYRQKHARPNLPAGYAPPSNDVEKRVAHIWSEALNLDQVGVNDNFFDLGGHSLLAVQIASRITKEFEMEIPVLDFFERPTVGTLSQMIAARRKNSEKEEAETEMVTYNLDHGRRRKELLNRRKRL